MVVAAHAPRRLRRLPVHPSARGSARPRVRRGHRLRREPGGPQRDRNRPVRSARAVRAAAVRARPHRAAAGLDRDARARRRRAHGERQRRRPTEAARAVPPPRAARDARRRVLSGRAGALRRAAAAFLRRGPVRARLGAQHSARSASPIAAALAAVVLLFPWPLAYATSHVDAASLGFAFRPDLSLCRAPAVPVGPVGRGWAMWGLLVGAAVPLFVATGARARRGRRAAGSSRSSGGPSCGSPNRSRRSGPMLAPEAGLTLAAFGLAVALGIGASVLVDGIRTFRFGWRQPAAILGGVALLLPDPRLHRRRGRRPVARAREPAGSTRSPSPTRSRRRASSASSGSATRRCCPLDPVVLPDGTGYTLTRNGSGNSSELLRAPGGRRRPRRRPRRSSSRATGSPTASGACSRPPGCAGSRSRPRRVRAAGPPVADSRAGAAPSTGNSTSPDSETGSGLVLYENLAWIPFRGIGGARPTPARCRSGPRDPTRAALGADLSAATAACVRRDRAAGHRAVGRGVRLRVEGHRRRVTTLEHVRAFGWENGYRVTERGPGRDRVRLTSGSAGRCSASSLLIWLFVVFRWWRTRVRCRGSASRTDRAGA